MVSSAADIVVAVRFVRIDDANPSIRVGMQNKDMTVFSRAYINPNTVADRQTIVAAEPDLNFRLLAESRGGPGGK
ncbi:MAG: hypothetical protein OEY63_00310 [Gemmatimonadota bacterium]|nr:hypothetical protein [Gemmatimonadota bacterium]